MLKTIIDIFDSHTRGLKMDTIVLLLSGGYDSLSIFSVLLHKISTGNIAPQNIILVNFSKSWYIQENKGDNETKIFNKILEEHREMRNIKIESSITTNHMTPRTTTASPQIPLNLDNIICCIPSNSTILTGLLAEDFFLLQRLQERIDRDSVYYGKTGIKIVAPLIGLDKIELYSNLIINYPELYNMATTCENADLDGKSCGICSTCSTRIETLILLAGARNYRNVFRKLMLDGLDVEDIEKIELIAKKELELYNEDQNGISE